MTTIETINLIIGTVEMALTATIAHEAWRLRQLRSVAIWGFIGFFAIDALVAINRTELLWKRAEQLTIATVLDLLALIVLVSVFTLGRKLVRGAVATVDLARYRVYEYERARRDYTQIVRHRMMNPLTVIEGAARTLEAETTLEPELRRKLLSTIVECAVALRETTLEPEQRNGLERDLDAVPRSPEDKHPNGRRADA